MALQTAEDKITELDFLRVNRLVVKDNMGVGDIGKKFIFMTVDNESAKIILSGGEMPKTYDGFSSNVDDLPAISLIAKNNGALIRAVSHSKRPEATSTLTVSNIDGKKYESGLILEDSNGTKVIFSNSTD